MKKLILTAVVLAAVAPLTAPSRAEAAAPRLATVAGTFPTSTLTLAQCTSRGRSALARLTFKNIKTSTFKTLTETSASAGNFSASITCATANKATFASIVAAGPVQATAQQVIVTIANAIVPPSSAERPNGWAAEAR